MKDEEGQLLNTHLGLLPRERMRQIEALMGPEWLENPAWRDPATGEAVPIG